MKKWISVFTLSTLCASVAIADEWPSNSIRLVVGYAAGGPVDTTARVFAQYLGKNLNVPVVVDNRPGASGMIAAESTARARPDGYTFNFVASPTLTITPLIQQGVRVNRETDFTYLGKIVDYTNVLVINNESKINSIAELVAFAKANPEEVSYGSAGVGASNHLSGELLSQRTAAPMLNIPYRGNAPAMVDVMSGKTTFMFDIISTAASYIDGGKVKPLAVTSKERNEALPDVPSMTEAGVPDYEVTGWYAMIAPKNLPPQITTKLQHSIKEISEQADFIADMKKAGYTVSLTDGQGLKEIVDREYAMWEEVIDKAGIEKQ